MEIHFLFMTLQNISSCPINLNDSLNYEKYVIPQKAIIDLYYPQKAPNTQKIMKGNNVQTHN